MDLDRPHILAGVAQCASQNQRYMHACACIATILGMFDPTMAPTTSVNTSFSAHAGPPRREIMRQSHCLPDLCWCHNSPACDDTSRHLIRCRWMYLLGRRAMTMCPQAEQRNSAMNVLENAEHGAQRWRTTAGHTTALKAPHTPSPPKCSSCSHTKISPCAV